MPDQEYRFNKQWPYHISSGGVVYRFKNDKLQIMLLVHHNGSHDIPKGTLRYGETLEQCALREAQEESGQKAKITGYLGSLLHEGVANDMDISKTTHYFALKWLSDTGTHDHEYNRIEWVSPQEAQDKLRPSSTGIVKRLVQFLEIFSDQN